MNLSFVKFSDLVRGCIWAITFSLLTYAWTTTAGVVSGALGSFAAVILVGYLNKITAFAVVFVGMIAGYLVRQQSWLVELLGLEYAISAAEVSYWGAVGFGFVFFLRRLSLGYYRLLVLPEICAIFVSVLILVSPHRDGMITRPLAIADWFWRQGFDPVIGFLLLGFLGAFLALGLMGKESKRPGQWLTQLLLVLILGGLVVSLVYSNVLVPLANPVSPGAKQANSGESKENSKKKPKTADQDIGQNKRDQNQRRKRPKAIVVFKKDVQPIGGVFYFQHAAFSQYNGIRLVEATTLGMDKDVVWRFPAGPIDIPSLAMTKDKSLAAGVRTEVKTQVALLEHHQRMFTLSSALRVEPKPNPSPARFNRAYEVTSSVIDSEFEGLLGHVAGDEDWSLDTWDHYTQVPRDERYHRLAINLDSTIVNEYAGDPTARALTIKNYLEDNTIYSLNTEYTGPDPTAEFLFSKMKKGYCTHLAHAAAFLLRILGVPARVSVGYAVMAENRGGGSALLIKSSDAHAWAEYYLQGIGWVPLEVTPKRTEHKPEPFNEQDLQQLLGEMAQKDTEIDTLHEYKSQSPILKYLGLAAQWLAKWWWTLVLGFVLLLYFFKILRKLRLYIFSKNTRLMYLASLERLASVGVLRKYGESHEAFAERVGSISPSFVRLSQMFLALSFGSEEQRSSNKEATKPLKLHRAVSRELSQAQPFWLLALAWLHPAPWWWVR